MTDAGIIKSPQLYARVGGGLYLLIIVLGFFAEGYVGDRLIVPTDAALTARNIMASPKLWDLSVAADFIVPVFAVVLLLIEYELLKPVNKFMVRLAVLFNLVSLAVESISKLFLIAVMTPLSGADYLNSFDSRQLETLAFLALKSHDVAFNIALVFFGFTLIIYGMVIFKSRYLPKFLGILVQIAGICYLIACFSALFVPTLYNAIFPFILLPPLVGEASFCLWLLIKGVDMTEWRARVSPSV